MLKELALSIPQYGEFKAPGGIPTGGLSTTGGKIIQTGIGIAFLFAIILCLFVIIWGGVQWISSGGDKQKLATARSRIMYSIVGLIIVLLSFLIVNLFTTFLGLPSPMSINFFQTGQTPPAAEAPQADAPAERTEGPDGPAVAPATDPVFTVSPQTQLGESVGIQIDYLPKAENTYTLRLTDLNVYIQFATHADGTCTLQSGDWTLPTSNKPFCGEANGDIQFNTVLDTNRLRFDTTSFDKYTYTLVLSGGTLEAPKTATFIVVNPNP